MTTILMPNNLVFAAPNNQGHNQFGSAGIIIAIVAAVLILIAWFVLRSRR